MRLAVHVLAATTACLLAGCAATLPPDSAALLAGLTPPPPRSHDDAIQLAGPPAAPPSAPAPAAAPASSPYYGPTGTILIATRAPVGCPTPPPATCTGALCGVTQPPLGTDAQDLPLCLPAGAWRCDPNGCQRTSGFPGVVQMTERVDIAQGVVTRVYGGLMPGTAGPLEQRIDRVAGPPAQYLDHGAIWLEPGVACVVAEGPGGAGIFACGTGSSLGAALGATPSAP